MKRPSLVLAALCLIANTACGGADDEAGASSGGPQVIGAFYPLAFVAEEVGGDHARVTNLSPPGVEPHDLELAPDQVRELSQADLIVHLGGGFQPGVEDILSQLDDSATLDALEDQENLLDGDHSHEDESDEHGESEGHESEEHGEEGALDPHMWLDPIRLTALGDAVAAELATIDPANASSYKDNAAAFADELAELDGELSSSLEDCTRSELVVSHEAFGYLTDRYGLEQVGVSGLDPEAEPSPGRVAEVAEYAEQHGVTTIFFEEQVAPDIAEVIADEVGAETQVLDPLEFPPDDDSDYFDVMRDNLKAITAALDCE